jgi:peptide/nickel transport system permease protein
MNYFVIGYYALLIGGSCLAAFYQKRSLFLLLFSLTLASFLMGILGGQPALWFVTVLAGLIALAAGTS